MALTRRDFLGVASATVALAASDASVAEAAQSGGESDWHALDTELRTWWSRNLTRADEKVICAREGRGLLFLPHDYVRIGESNTIYTGMFPDDAAYFNMSLLAHDRPELVRMHILNYIFWIQRYGYAPNANVVGLTTRSSVHMLPLTALRYVERYRDVELLEMVYPAIKHEYRDYWLGPQHQTPTGLSTFRDLGDPLLSATLASEAESAMDWTPIWGGDVRQCVPINLNSILVIYARVLGRMAKLLGRTESEVRGFLAEAEARAERIRRLCWNPELETFLEYNYVTQQHVPVYSDGCFWALWGGVATEAQAKGVVKSLYRFEKPFGLTVTDRAYPDPHGEESYRYLDRPGLAYGAFAPESPAQYHGGTNPLMWMYPAGWATTQVIGCAGLDAYGYSENAQRLARKFLAVVIEQWKITGKLWEKYNLEDGSLVLPNARYGNIPYYSFTGAAVTVLGRYLHADIPFAAVAARWS